MKKNSSKNFFQENSYSCFNALPGRHQSGILGYFEFLNGDEMKYQILSL